MNTPVPKPLGDEGEDTINNIIGSGYVPSPTLYGDDGNNSAQHYKDMYWDGIVLNGKPWMEGTLKCKEKHRYLMGPAKYEKIYEHVQPDFCQKGYVPTAERPSACKNRNWGHPFVGILRKGDYILSPNWQYALFFKG